MIFPPVVTQAIDGVFPSTVKNFVTAKQTSEKVITNICRSQQAQALLAVPI